MTIPVPLELQIKFAEWRRKAAEGTITLDEMKEAVLLVRAGRMAASAAAQSSKRTAAKKVIPNASELLDELDGL